MAWARSPAFSPFVPRAVEGTAEVAEPGPIRSGGGAVALLVLAPGTARARRVAPDLVAAGLGRHAGLVPLAVAHLHALGTRPGRLVLADQLHPVDVADELLGDAILHLPEHGVRLALVLHQRVALAVGPEVDAFLQVVHLVQVLPPLVVDDREQDHPLQLPHGLRPDQLLLLLVGRHGFLEDLVQDLGQVVGALQVRHPQLGRVDVGERREHGLEVPFLREDLGGHVLRHRGLDRVGDHLQGVVAEVPPLQDLAPLRVDHPALRVHDLVVLEDVLASLEVDTLDLPLGALDGPADHPGRDGLVLRPLQAVHDPPDALRGEQPHEVVLQREVELRGARVALAARPAPQLVVDAAGLVALRAQDVEAPDLHDLVVLGVGLGLELAEDGLVLGLVLLALLRFHVEHQVPVVVEAAGGHLLAGQVLGVAAQEDVHASPGHVGGHRDRPEPPRLGHDHGLLLVVLRVQHVVGDAPATEVPGQALGLLDRHRADQDRLALLVAFRDVLGDRPPLGVLALVDEVLLVVADHGAVGGDLHHAQLVDLLELHQLGLGRPGHAGELVVHPEVVLDGDGGEGLVLLLDPDALLGLDGLVEALGVPAALQDPTGELVDDLHLAVGDDVVDVALVELLGPQRVLEVVHQRRVHVLVQVLDAQDLLDLAHALFRDRDGALGLLDLVVLVLAQARRDAGERLVPLRGVGHHAADDQRGPGLVDEDGVRLVHDGEVVPSLHHLVQAHGHVVAQVVEAELVVGAVGDVGRVRGATLLRVHAGLDQPDGDAQRAEDRPHPLGVALGQVVVHGDYVDAFAAQGIQVARQRGDERLSFTGLHLGDVALVQDDAAHQLDVEVALPDGALGGLPDAGERLREDVVQGLAVGQTLLELIRLGAQLGVGELLDLRFERPDDVGDLGQLLDLAALSEIAEFVEYQRGLLGLLRARLWGTRLYEWGPACPLARLPGPPGPAGSYSPDGEAVSTPSVTSRMFWRTA